MNRFRLSGSTRLRDVLRRHHRPLDYEQVELGLEQCAGQLGGPLRRDRAAGGHPGLFDLADALAHELGLERLGVDLLHAGGRLLGREPGDLDQIRLGVLVTGPEPLQIEHADAAEAADLDRRRRADDAVHGRRHERQLETERVDLPGDVHVLGVPRAPRRDDRDVVESVRPPPGLPDSDLDLSHALPPRLGLRVCAPA